MPHAWAEMQALGERDPRRYATYLAEANAKVSSYATQADLEMAFRNEFVPFFDDPEGR